MAAFHFTVTGNLALKVIPETRVFMDGHPILTHSYSIYKDVFTDDPEETLMGDDDTRKQSNPNYLGFVTFEIPGKLYHYTADGVRPLSRQEIEEIIDQISHYRDNPQLWRQTHH